MRREGRGDGGGSSCSREIRCFDIGVAGVVLVLMSWRLLFSRHASGVMQYHIKKLPLGHRNDTFCYHDPDVIFCGVSSCLTGILSYDYRGT